MARGIYQGKATMEAERAQSLWDVLQGQKRHKRKEEDVLGKRALLNTIGDIWKTVDPGTGHIFAAGIEQGAQHMWKMPKYTFAEDPSFWGSSQIAEYEEQAKEIKRGADTSLLESIIGQGSDYVGREDFNLEKDFDFITSLFSREGGGIEGTPVSGGDTMFMAREGGRVPKKYYGGGSVSGGSPTIAGYFSQQGKTLGGSNTQSLAEKLGRK